MYLFDNENLSIQDIIKLNQDEPLSLLQIKNSIQSMNKNNFEAFLFIYTENSVLFDEESLKRIYLWIAEKEDFTYYINRLYDSGITPYTVDKKNKDFISHFYDKYPLMCHFLQAKGFPKIMRGIDSVSNYALINNDYDKFNKIVAEGYDIDKKLSMVSLLISRFPRNEKEVQDYINTFIYLLPHLSEEESIKYKDKIYTKIFLFEDIKIKEIERLKRTSSSINFKIDFNIYHDEKISLENLYQNFNLFLYMYKNHKHEENLISYKKEFFEGFINLNTIQYEQIDFIYNLLDIKISDDEASFIFHDLLAKPSFIKFMIKKDFNFEIDYSVLTRNVIKNLTSSPEHFDNHYSYYRESPFLKTLFELCDKKEFDPNFQYKINYFEKDREKTNTTNILEIFINNDRDGYLLNKLNSLSVFNYTDNLVSLFQKYYDSGKLEKYCEINYENIYKSGFMIDKDKLLNLVKNFTSSEELEKKVKTLCENIKIKHSLNYKNEDYSVKKQKRI